MDLQAMFSQGNPFLAQMAEQQWNTEQQKRQQDLQTSLQASQRAQELHPLEMAGKKAGTAYNQALTDETNQRIVQKMKENFFKLQDTERQSVADDMAHRFQLASAIKANGGILPLYLQGKISPEELTYYSGPNLDETLKITRTFNENSPKWLMEDKKEKAKFDREKEIQLLRNQGTLGAASIRASTAGSGAGAGKMSLEQYLTTLNRQLATMPDGPEKEKMQAEADRTEVQILRKAVAGRLAGQAGTVDPAATAEAGKPVLRPPVDTSPTPRQQQWTPPNGWK